MLRILALAGALVVPATALALAATGVAPGVLDLVWLLPVVAGVLVLPYALKAELAIAPVLASLLAAAATHLASTGGMAMALRDPPGFDITETALDPGARGIAEVRGHLLRDVSVAEYRGVQPGAVADQNSDPDAKLMLMLPVPAGAVEAPSSLVVVRLPRGASPARRDGADVVTGKLDVAPPELAGTLLLAASLPAPTDSSSVLLLDAGAVGESAESRGSLPLAGLLGLGAVGLVLWRRDPPAADESAATS